MNRITLAPSLLALLLTSLLALGVSLGDAEAQTTACDSKIQALEINSTTLHYLECGKGEPLVFVHGALGDLHTFQPQVQAFAIELQGHRLQPAFLPAQRSAASDRRQSSQHPRCRSASADRATERGSGASRGELVVARTSRSRWHWPIPSSCAASCSASRPSSRSSPARQWEKRCACRGTGGSSSHHERRLRAGAWRAVCERSWTAFVGEPGVSTTSRKPAETELVEKQAPELRSQWMTEPSANLPPLDCGDLGKLKRPTLLVTGEQSPAMFFLITAELERCLEGESQVMVPDAGHGMHGQNTAFYNQTVLAFLQRR